MQILSVINFAAAVQGLFLSYLLINRKPDSREHNMLALLVLVMSLAILGAVLGLSGYYRELPHLIRVGDPLVLLFGPLLFFYIHLLTKGVLPLRYWLHLIPFAVYLATLVPFYSLSAAEKIAFVDKVFLDNRPNAQVTTIQLIRLAHVLAYVLASYFLLRGFSRFLKDNYSDLDRLNLDKATILLQLFIGLTFFRLCLYVAGYFIHLNFVVTNNIISLMTSVVIYALAYSVWNRTAKPDFQATTGRPASVEPPGDEAGAQERLRNTYYLSEEQSEALAEKLEQLFREEKLYLLPELSLSQLSERLGVPSYLASELLNRKYKDSFFDFINRNRIEEVKRRLADPAFSHYSILGIAMDCGFNSKSSFNTAFKKFTGSTPSEYRQR
ncbi:MAG TPA: helix-turn-helix domain-containing protein [Saprospiraceae bacterium]|nr:helix-turn-helix domain-containing protein [Saprospiraceae bacterium]HNM25923.1 helix-turn-helix domain-containing protein [Saprospiraceae bacterium]